MRHLDVDGFDGLASCMPGEFDGLFCNFSPVRFHENGQSLASIGTDSFGTGIFNNPTNRCNR